ncbi:MAG: hypothetical protein JXR40_12020 [Pontiellaceae bacterium]|nr:hypothetical protein [Pontiellaceae bacterium]
MTDPSAKQFSNLHVPRILVMGVGSSGSRAVSGLSGLPEDVTITAVDTDSKLLSELEVGSFVHVGESITHGLSAGGAVELGRQSVEKDSSGIRRKLRDVDLVVLVGGLGGGTGSGALPVVTRIAREAGCLILAVVSMPFDFEGKMKKSAAEDSMKRVRTHADAVIRVSNERLLSRADADISVEDAFFRSHQVMRDGVGMLCRLISSVGVCSLDFACIHTMLKNCDGFCNLALGRAAGPNRAEAVAEALLTHPLLGNVEPWSRAEGVIVGVTGGSSLALSEIETIMKKIQGELPPEVWFNFGVLVDPDGGDELSAMVLLAEQWKEPLVDSAGRQIAVRERGGQAEFALETVGKGKFAHVNPTIHNNQDLDVPTYIRREIKLPR